MTARARATVLFGGATISECGRYLYRLRREWAKPLFSGIGVLRTCGFVMLNPSTADANQDDPTIRRCMAFARSWGYDAMEVVNLFAYRVTDPQELEAMVCRQGDPVGPGNDAAIADCRSNDVEIMVAAWGAWGRFLKRGEHVRSLLTPYGGLHVLALTKDGEPRHPLYLKGDLTPEPWEVAT